MSRFSRTPQNTQRARRLRAEATPAERKLWAYLRGEQLGAPFRRQHPIGPFYADFCCTSLKLIVELDGGQHFEQAARDAARTTYLREQGFEVMRFWNNEVMEGLDAVCEQVAWAVRRKRFEADASADPLPSSPLQGEG